MKVFNVTMTEEDLPILIAHYGAELQKAEARVADLKSKISALKAQAQAKEEEAVKGKRGPKKAVEAVAAAPAEAEQPKKTRGPKAGAKAAKGAKGKSNAKKLKGFNWEEFLLRVTGEENRFLTATDYTQVAAKELDLSGEEVKAASVALARIANLLADQKKLVKISPSGKKRFCFGLPEFMDGDTPKDGYTLPQI